MDSKKRKRDIVDWIGRPRKLTLSNDYDEAEGNEEDVSATEASTEDNSLIDEYKEGCEYYQWYDSEDTRLSDAKITEKEASSRHKGKSLLSDSSEMSDNSDDDDDGTGDGNNNWYGNGKVNSRGDNNNNSRGGSTEWMGFLNPNALSEIFGAID